jgi:hypothetical protein
MTTWKWAAGGVALFVLGVLAAVLVRSVERGRDLAETLLWMDQTYNPHDGGENYGRGHGKQVHSLETYRQQTETVSEDFDETFTYAKCYVTIRDETLPIGIFSHSPSTRTLKFNLGDLDPLSFKLIKYDFHKDGLNCADPDEVSTFNLDCREAELQVSTRDGATSVDELTETTFTRLQGTERKSKISSKDSMVWFNLDDLAYAERFEKALKHAIELCGGQSSKF